MLTKLIVFSLFTWPAIAMAVPSQSAASGEAVEVTGELEVLYFDDFDHHRGEIRYFVHNKHQNERFQLEFQGEPPKDATNGAFVRVRGKSKNNLILMAANGTNSFETLAPATVMVSGDQKTIVLVANFKDAAVPAACTTLAVEDTLFTDPNQKSVNHLYRETSHDNVQFSGAVAGPFMINYSSTDTCDVSAWAQAAEAQAQAQGIILGNYNRKVYVLPKQNSCGYAGLSTVGGNPSRSWIFRCDLPDVFAHELGHSLGMGHAGNATGDYNDTSDIMGFSGLALRQINGPHQEQMGWRNSLQITEITTDGIYNIAPLELDAASSGGAPQVIKIRKPDTAEWYYLSFRQPIGFDGSLADTYLTGLSIHRHAGNGSASKTVWLDTLVDNESYSDTVNGLTITQLSHTDSSVSIQVDLTATCTSNTPTVSVAPQSQTDLAGTTLNYDLTITNNDTASCPASNWTLATQIPSAWSDALTSSVVFVAPGSSATVNWQVSSANTAADGSYALTADLTDPATTTHKKSIVANYTVTTPSDIESPTIPSGLTASLQRKQISVSWMPSTDNIAVAGYKIFRNDILIATTASTNYSDPVSTLTSGTTYTYKVLAFDAANNKSSLSNPSSVTYGSTGGKRK